MAIRIFIFILAFCTLSAAAQTSIEVVDSEKNGLPNAHITYASLTNKESNTILSNLDGIAIIPKVFTSKNPRFVISITYVGFVKIDKDTINADAKVRIVMQEDMVSLNQVVVTGQYSPNDPEKAVQKIEIISSEKIEAMAAVNLNDVLVNELNMTITQDGVLGSQITMQGLGGENVKILIDGVPVIGRTDGNIDLNQINMNNIERIEVIEGPMSVTYGTNALAGTINLITKKGSSQKWDAGIHAYAESVGRFNLDANTGFNKGPHQVSLDLGRNYFNGWSQGDEPFEQKEPIADSTRVQEWNPKEQYFLNFQYAYNLANWTLRYKGDYFDEKITDRNYPDYYQSTFDNYYLTDRFDNSVFANGKFSKNFTGNFIVAYNIYKRRIETYLKDLTNLEQDLIDDPDVHFYNWTIRGFVANVNESKIINYEVGYDVNLEEAGGERISSGTKIQNDYALYSTAEIRPGNTTVIRPGIRIAYNTNFDHPIIPTINIKQDIGKVALRFSYGRGFRAPNLKEQYLDFVDSNHEIYGNPNLEAENSNNFSISGRYTSLLRNSIFKAELSGFYNKILNKIELSPIQGIEFTYINLDVFQTTGISGNFKMDLSHFKFSIGGSYIGELVETEDGYSSPGFTWSPQVQFNAGYEIKRIGLTASLFLKYQGLGPYYFMDEDNVLQQSFVDAYTWADFTLSQRLWRNQINLSVGAKNLFDVQSVDAGLNSGGAHSDGGSRLIGMGRTFFISLKYNLKNKA